MENRDLQGSWGGATVRQDYAMMMMMMMIYYRDTNKHIISSHSLTGNENWTGAQVVNKCCKRLHDEDLVVTNLE